MSVVDSSKGESAAGVDGSCAVGAIATFVRVTVSWVDQEAGGKVACYPGYSVDRSRPTVRTHAPAARIVAGAVLFNEKTERPMDALILLGMFLLLLKFSAGMLFSSRAIDVAVGVLLRDLAIVSLRVIGYFIALPFLVLAWLVRMLTNRAPRRTHRHKRRGHRRRGRAAFR